MRLGQGYLGHLPCDWDRDIQAIYHATGTGIFMPFTMRLGQGYLGHLPCDCDRDIQAIYHAPGTGIFERAYLSH